MEIKKLKRTKCCICGNTFVGYGNNPWPVKSSGRCCDECNFQIVIPERIYNLKNKEDNEN